MVKHWEAGETYTPGNIVIYEGYYYRNIQAHTSQNDWCPDKTPALWGRQNKVNEVFSSKEDRVELETCHEQVTKAEHKAKLSHELVAGAAAFEAARAWGHHKAKNGEAPSHAHAKELAAGLLGGFIDRIVETKGLDYIDKEKAKRQAQDRTNEQLASNY